MGHVARCLFTLLEDAEKLRQQQAAAEETALASSAERVTEGAQEGGEQGGADPAVDGNRGDGMGAELEGVEEGGMRREKEMLELAFPGGAPPVSGSGLGVGGVTASDEAMDGREWGGRGGDMKKADTHTDALWAGKGATQAAGAGSIRRDKKGAGVEGGSTEMKSVEELRETLLRVVVAHEGVWVGAGSAAALAEGGEGGDAARSEWTHQQQTER